MTSGCRVFDMKRAALLATAGMLALSGSAQASDPFQAWFAVAKPRPYRIHILEASCPGASILMSCAMPSGHAIYVVRPHGYPASWRRHFFLHEIGHEFDFQHLTARTRRQFLRLVGLKTWGTGGEPRTGIEWFAEAYSFCAYPLALSAASYGYVPHRGVCDWLAKRS